MDSPGFSSFTRWGRTMSSPTRSGTSVEKSPAGRVSLHLCVDASPQSASSATSPAPTAFPETPPDQKRRPSPCPCSFRARGSRVSQKRHVPLFVEGAGHVRHHFGRDRFTIPDAGGKGVCLMATSAKDASKAGKILSNPKSSSAAKSVAASDLAQKKSGRK
jgi:hypothetical protein